MRFGGIARTSTIDYPGVLACVLFAQGCNLDCFYCHNRGLIAGGEGSVAEAEVRDFLHRRQGLLDGVVISGGEPTIQPDLAEFAEEVKELGYRLKLDTNGMYPDRVGALLESGLLDYVAVDYKAPAEQYGAVCGGDAARVRQTIELLRESGVAYEVRTTVYPGLTAEGLMRLMEEVPPAPRYRLNVYQTPAVMEMRYAELYARRALRRADLEALLPKLKQIQPNLCDW